MASKTEETAGTVSATASATETSSFEQPSTPLFPGRATNLFSPNTTAIPSLPTPSVSPGTPKDVVTNTKGLSADIFAQACGFFGGPTVTIYVGPGSRPKKYTLPKTYLCTQSGFLKDYFDMGVQTINFGKENPRIFELVIQWIYTGNVVLPPSMIPMDSPENITKHRRELITAYLDFFMLCDKLIISEIGQESIILEIKSLILLSRDALGPGHIRTAVNLPTGHAVRRLFAQAAAKDFVVSKRKGQEPFIFAKEVDELPEFAADLLLECGNIFANIFITSKTLFGSGTLQGPVSIDPFTGYEFSLSPAPK